MNVPHEDAMTNNDTKKAGLFRRIHWKPLRFVQLFILIILVMLLSPVLHKTPLLSALLAVFFLNILIVTLSSAGFHVRWRWPLILLWIMGTLMNTAAFRNPNHPFANMLIAASEFVSAVLIVICVVMILRYVLTSREVTVDTVFGAFVAYFLIAFTFSSIYQALAIIEPASFSMPNSPTMVEGYSRNIEFGYFSFVTIASLGYGDIVPRLPVSRMLSILEVVIGQFYMAVVVAWLVSSLAGSRSCIEAGGGNGKGLP
jgi:hypothetical protein